jgi:hypothetical protein
LLHPGGDVRRVADGGVIHTEIVADATDDHRARVEADAHPDGRPVAGLDLAAEITHRALDAERGVHGAARAVFVRDGRAKQGHDAIAGVLVDRPFEPMDLCRNRLETPVHDLMHILGVAPLGRAREAGDVGEHHGDLAALSLDRRSRFKHFVGEVPWRVRGHARTHRRGAGSRRRGVSR